MPKYLISYRKTEETGQKPEWAGFTVESELAMEAHAVELGILAWNRSVVDCSLVPGGTTVRYRDGSYHENAHHCGELWVSNVARFQPDGLGRPQPTPVHQLQERPVTQGDGV